MTEIGKNKPPVDSQFKPGESGNPSGRPKGSINLATRIQRMLDDDDFTTTMVDAKGKKVNFKGNPAEAIIRTAVLKAMSGEKDWAEWLAKHGFGNKQVLEFQNSPIDTILEKYGLKEPEDGEKEEDAGQAKKT